MRKLLFESVFRRPLTERAPSPDDAAVAELATALGQAARRRLGRSLSIREVDAGSCNGCELEIHALNNAYYDVERFGLRFVASPRHADVLMVTGTGDEKHARGARAHLSRDAEPEMGRRGRRLRAERRMFCRQLCGRRRRLRGRPGRPAHSRLPACPHSHAARIAGAARTRGRGRRYVVRNAIEPAPAPSSVGGRSCSLSWGLSWDL